jgi:hypothetical protein
MNYLRLLVAAPEIDAEPVLDELAKTSETDRANHYIAPTSVGYWRAWSRRREDRVACAGGIAEILGH